MKRKIRGAVHRGCEGLRLTAFSINNSYGMIYNTLRKVSSTVNYISIKMNKKRFFKISGIIIGLLIFIGACGYAYLFYFGGFSLGSNCGYFKDNNTVYYAQPYFGGCSKATIVEGVDIQSFKKSRTHIFNAKDKNLVYFDGVAMQGSDGPSFVDDDPNYAYDKNQAYKEGRLISGADGGSFTVIVEGVYAKDKNRVYNYGKPIALADPSTFQFFSGNVYMKDKNNVYFSANGVEIKNLKMADVNTFKVTGNGFAEDKNNKYYNGEITSIDKSHKVFGETPYLTDDNHVYYKGEIINNADPKSFEIFDAYLSGNGFYAKDRSHVYFENNLISEADPSTFVILGSYGKDKNFVFFKGKKIENSDGPTFELNGLECCIGKDKNYVYSGSCIYKDNKQISCVQ